jgi:hypothetical protein
VLDLSGVVTHVPLSCTTPLPPGPEWPRRAWEARDLGGVCVLLSNRRWERRLVKFLKPSGVVRVMADGMDEDEARAERMDGWIV